MDSSHTSSVEIVHTILFHPLIVLSQDPETPHWPSFLALHTTNFDFFFFFAIPHFPLRTINHHQFYPQCLFYSPDLLKLRPSLVFKYLSCVRHCGRRWLILKVYSSLSFRKAILILSRAHNCSAKGKS